MVISTFTPTPTPQPVAPNLPEFKLHVLERLQQSAGEPVRFTCEIIPKHRVRARVRMSVSNLGPQMIARFKPPTFTLPGVSVLTVAWAPGAKGPIKRDIVIRADAIPLDTPEGPVLSATREVSVVFTPGSQPDPKRRTILNRKIPIYLTTDADLMEEPGDVVRIGGRLGVNPGVTGVEIFVKRGLGLPFYARVPLPEGDDRFLVEVPVSPSDVIDVGDRINLPGGSPLTLMGVWRVGAQLYSNEPGAPVIGRSGILTIPVGALRNTAKWAQPKKVLAQEDILSSLFGNIIMVAGTPDSRLTEETLDRLVSDRYTEMTTERRFSGDRLTVYSEQEIGDEGDVPVTSPVTTQAIINRVTSIPAGDPLTIYMVGSVEEPGLFRLSEGEILGANMLGAALAAEKRTGLTLLIIDCDHAAALGSVIRLAAGGNPNLQIIAGTGSEEDNIAIFSTVPETGQPFSFSDVFFDQLAQGILLDEAFEEAKERVTQVQGPVRIQVPVSFPDPISDAFVDFAIGMPYVEDLDTRGVPDNVEPVLYTGSQTSSVVYGDDLPITASVSDESAEGGALLVSAHIAPSDSPDRFVEIPMDYNIENDQFETVLANFPEGTFGPDIASELFTISIFAEDDSGNSADPLVTSVNVTERPEPEWSISYTDTNGDGVTNTEDLLTLQNFWHGESEIDLNGDGVWGPLDILLYQLAWRMDWEE